AFACLVGGNKFYAYEVYRNDELLENTIIPAAKSFWFDNVQALKEPELQAGDTELMNSVFAEVKKNSEIMLEDEEADNLAFSISEAKQQIKQLEKIVEEAQNRLKERLGNHEIGYCRNYTVKWSP
ncbi:hypothetical protein, partial [Hymenobacter terricola]|uniref:hypothetical protein n=1 Tax=Hymenobacter terricola TaxID=2819236 RepID=UPI001CF21A7E